MKDIMKRKTELGIARLLSSVIYYLRKDNPEENQETINYLTNIRNKFEQSSKQPK